MALTPLTWVPCDGGERCDLADAGEGAGTFLAVLPHPEPDYFRPLCVLVPGEEEREVGDGVLGREHARDTIVKYAIQTLARLNGLSPEPRQEDEDATWPRRTLARLWTFLEAGPHEA